MKLSTNLMNDRYTITVDTARLISCGKLVGPERTWLCAKWTTAKYAFIKRLISLQLCWAPMQF